MDCRSKERRQPISSNQNNLRMSLSPGKEKSHEARRTFHVLTDPELAHIGIAEVTNICDMISAPLCRGEAGSRIVGKQEVIRLFPVCR
jgi:hypothetical protein